MRPVRAIEPRFAASWAEASAYAVMHPTMHPTHDFRGNSHHVLVPERRPRQWTRLPGADMMSEDAKFALGY